MTHVFFCIFAFFPRKDLGSANGQKTADRQDDKTSRPPTILNWHLKSVCTLLAIPAPLLPLAHIYWLIALTIDCRCRRCNPVSSSLLPSNLQY